MRLLSNCRRFLSDRRGNIAILFGLAVVPIFGMMGAALDYSMANMQRTQLQAAADNTVLMLSKMMPMSDDALNTQGWKIFQANMGSTPLQYTQPSLVITQTSNGKLTLQIDTQYPLTLGGVMAKIFGTSPYMAVDVHSEVQWGNTRLRVALVLDNSGSMSQSNKITALKTATKNLITTLSGVAKNPEDVYVSVIPFSKDVNAGNTNYNANWIYWGNAAQDPTKSDNNSWDAQNGTCSVSNGPYRAACVSAHCSSSRYTSKSSCQSAGRTWYNAGVGVWTPANHNTWNGCIQDRGFAAGPATSTTAGNDQLTIATDTTKNETLFPAEQYGYCTQTMQGLTNNWSTLNTIVDNMQPNGSTNQPLGLVWGWQSLVGGGPLATIPMDTANYAYSQVIILLSDGLNTQDRWWGDGYNTSTDVDYRMYYKDASNNVSGTCQNIKNANITIYTVQVNTGGDPQSAVLKNCASDPSKFFMLTSSDEIVTTFDQIGSALANIHISK